VRVEPFDNGRIDFWRRYLCGFAPRARYRHDKYALKACHLAVDAAGVGTYGVGAVLFDATGEVVAEGRNKVHEDSFRSDLHAEMVVMNEYEGAMWPRDKARECTLVTSLEPCPMCMTRLIMAGIGAVFYMAGDFVGGMVRRTHALPPTFRTIIESQGQVWRAADCSGELRAAARMIWMESRETVHRRLPIRQGLPEEKVAAS